MADWAYQPQYDAGWVASPPPTLITRLADGKTIRRQKNATAVKRWEETYWFTKTEHDAAYAFYLTKLLLTSFTKLSWDVGATPTQERTVYFASEWNVIRTGDDWFTVTLSFELAI